MCCIATGLLVVGIGNGTKAMTHYTGCTKIYSGEFRLGEATPSMDTEEEVSQRLPWEHVSDDMLTEASRVFLGQ